MRGLLKGLAFAVTATLSAGASASEASCPTPGALGVSRTVQIDTKGGPGFGLEHYKAYDFLQPKEVVLTFDDGPQKFSTKAILAALDKECVKATFFSIGKMALGYPEILRDVAKAGHTIGTHTWSHKAIRKLKTFDDGKMEIELGISAVKRAVGGPVAPFFRFPTLVDTPESVAYLGERNIAMFSTDIDSFDFKVQTPPHIVKTLMTKLEKKGKGILLMHDIHKRTAEAVPLLLAELKAKGYKIVHLTAQSELTTLPEFDAKIEKDAKGLPQAGSERPLSSVVRTIEGTPPSDESEAAAPQGPAAVADEPATPPASSPQKTNAVVPEGAQHSAPAVTTAAPVAGTTTSSISPSPVTTVRATHAAGDSTDGATPKGAPDEAANAKPASPSMTERAKAFIGEWLGKKE